MMTTTGNVAERNELIEEITALADKIRDNHAKLAALFNEGVDLGLFRLEFDEQVNCISRAPRTTTG